MLTTARDTRTDSLLAFIATWSAFEIFVSTTFSAYEAAWIDGMKKSTGVPEALDRITEVMRDKYRFVDKFSVISWTLSPANASSDIEELKKYKTRRDDFMHGKDLTTTFPTAEVDLLLNSYLRLHLDR